MSQAFVKESDDNGMLHQISPTVPALINYLRRENGGQAVFVRDRDVKDGKEIVQMSNGFCYFINKDHQWEMKI